MNNQEKPNLTQERTNKEKVLIAFFIGAIISACISLFGLRLLAEGIKELIIGFVIIIFLLGLIFFIVTLNKEWFFKRLFGVSSSDINDVKESSIGLFENATEGNWKEAKNDFEKTFGKASALYVWASYRRWVITVFYTLFIGFAGLLGSVLLYNQNQLLVKQNEKIDTQNDRLNFQNNLIEAERRSSLVFLMSNVLDKVDEEIAEQRKARKNPSDNFQYSLSKPLISRIVALSKAFRPYHFMEGDSLSDAVVSPERGQLFIALMGSNLDSATQNTIVENGNFSYATMQNLQIESPQFFNAKLDFVDLSSISINDANFWHAKLYGASFFDAFLENANFQQAALSEANFIKSIIWNGDFFSADLELANFSEADLSGTNFSFSNLRNANLENASLENTDFRGANFNRTHLSVGQLKQAKSLFNSENLNPQIERQLRQKKPCLFTEEGC